MNSQSGWRNEERPHRQTGRGDLVVGAFWGGRAVPQPCQGEAADTEGIGGATGLLGLFGLFQFFHQGAHVHEQV